MTDIYTAKVTVRDDYIETIKEVLESGMFTLGKRTAEFENTFAKHMGVRHAIAVANGTVSIELILRGLGIECGDEVIVPSHTTMPTIEPILHLGAKPVFVDIDSNYTIDPGLVENALTSKTKAILPVHIYGNPADMNRLITISEKHGIPIVEDCAQAHDAMVGVRKVGSIGIAGSFSFYPSKNMTVLGEGGMVTTNDDELARKIRILRNHGQDGLYNHVMLGNNYRLSEIHAALGTRQLEELEDFTKLRRERAQWYADELKDAGVKLPAEPMYGKSVYHLYVIRVDAAKRDTIIADMKKKDVHCGIHYPVPCHQQPIFSGNVTLPETEKAAKEIISLPMYPLLTREDVKRVCNALISVK